VANARSGNVFYVDATGELTTDSSIKVIGILFTTNAANDQLVLRESSGGSNKINIKHVTANDTKFIDLSSTPILFSRGIYVSTLTASATATLITSTGGGN
jgi:hypothetical protein